MPWFSAKNSYDPVTGTNWCHLSLELRAKCIEKMDFKTRIRLGSTSMTEKLLVEDAGKYHFDKLDILHYDHEFTVSVKNGANLKNSELITVNRALPWDTKVKVVLRLLKTCDIDELQYQNFSEFSKTVITDLAECVPFRFKRLTTIFEDWKTMKFFLDNSPNLEVLTSESSRTFYEAFDHRVVANVKEFRIQFLKNLVHASKLIGKWIGMDAEVGKSFQFITDKSINGFFAAAFKERFIQENRDVVRIRMNNETKQIILRKVGYDDDNDEYVSCKVVPIDLPESEYGNGDEWITKLLKQRQSSSSCWNNSYDYCGGVLNSEYDWD